MGFVLITHKVEDYAAWKRGFDQASDLRKFAGEIDYKVLSYEGDPNMVIHLSRWQSFSQARNFFESDKVAKIRKELGVETPDFVYLNELESAVL